MIGSLLAVSLAWAQKQQPVVVPEFHPSSIGDGIYLYKDMPTDLTLVPKEAGGRNGKLWIRNIGSALLIAGQVDGAAPDFPRNQTQILAKDHIEVWLATVPDVPMPPIGWGNQFGEELLPKGADSCAEWAKQDAASAPAGTQKQQKCRAWAAEQQQYRNAFRKLFVRQWLLTPDYAIEVYATPAYDLITTKYASDQAAYKDEIPETLKPKGKVQMWYSPLNGGQGYTFQIAIPYSAFPPANTLDLENLWLMVDVFNPAPQGKKMGAYSSSSPLRTFGKPETFNQLQLKPRRSFRVAPCDIGLDGTDKYGAKHPGWFLPQHDQFVLGSEFESETFILVNEANGYAYLPSGVSPMVRTVHHFWHSVGENQWVCGPGLAYQKGLDSRHYEDVVAEEGFDAKTLKNGTLLIKSGPRVYYSEFGSGQCGACPRYDLEIFAIDKTLKLTEALSLGGVVQGDNDAVDISVSRDWSEVVEYKEQRTESTDANGSPFWSATTYCLDAVKYTKCGEKKDVHPPNPPVLKELRDSDNM